MCFSCPGVSLFCLSLSSCNVMSSALSCFRKPWLGRMQRRCRTCSTASTTDKLCLIIKYASTRVADLLRPITQCTNTLSRTKQRRRRLLYGGSWCKRRASARTFDLLRLTVWLAQGFVNELGCRLEELGYVEGGFVVSLYTIIADVRIAVVTSTSQHVVPLSLSCVKNMCNSQISQTRKLQSRFPETDSV